MTVTYTTDGAETTAPKTLGAQAATGAPASETLEASGRSETSGFSAAPLLEVHDIVKEYRSARAVDGVTFELRAGESLAIIGESGSGKTTATRIALGLASPDSGEVFYRGRRVDMHRRGFAGLRRGDSALRALRRESGIVFQDPYASLDPRWRIRRSVAEPLRARGVPWCEAAERADAALSAVGLDADEYGGRFPQDLSGGQAQRAAIARALVIRPRVLLADEPMSAIDVTSRLQILDTLRAIRSGGLTALAPRAEHGQAPQGAGGPDAAVAGPAGQDAPMAMIVVLHDLGIVRQLADRVLVMHEGRVVESGTVDRVLGHPRDPYTLRLIEAATMDPASD